MDWGRVVVLAGTALLLVVAAAVWLVRWRAAERLGVVGIDHRTFVTWGYRFLDTGSLYLPEQLVAPFDAQPIAREPALLPAMYPPTAAYLFVALTVLPSVVWWLIPLVVVGYALWAWRPARWSWPLLAAALCWPASSSIVIVGGSTMWVAAAVAGGLLWGWPGLTVLLKPSLAPLALVGIRHHSWWIAGSALVLASVPLIVEWAKYLIVVGNAVGLSLLFSLGDAPLLAIPVFAWLARTRTRATIRRTSPSHRASASSPA